MGLELDWTWLLFALPVVFALGWVAARIDLKQWRRESRESSRAIYKGVNLLLNEQPDKAIDAFIQAMQRDPDLDHEQRFVTKLLREELGYRHLVLTDDMEMGAILKHCPIEDAAKAGPTKDRGACLRVDLVDVGFRSLELRLNDPAPPRVGARGAHGARQVVGGHHLLDVAHHVVDDQALGEAQHVAHGGHHDVLGGHLRQHLLSKKQRSTW